MQIESPDAFFLRNGGAALLAANGIDPAEGLKGLFSRRYPTWPKEGGGSSLSGIGTNKQVGIVLVAEGRLEVRGSARLADPGAPGIVISRAMAGLNLARFLCDCMDLPRPFLLLSVNGSSRAAIDDARLTLDPRLVECHGAVSFVLDSERVESINAYASHFRLKPAALQELKASLEWGMASRGQRDATIAGRVVLHPTHPGVIGRVSKILGLGRIDLADPDPEQVARVKGFWEDIASLPASGDFAWTLASLPAERAGDGEVA